MSVNLGNGDWGNTGSMDLIDINEVFFKKTFKGMNFKLFHPTKEGILTKYSSYSNHFIENQQKFMLKLNEHKKENYVDFKIFNISFKFLIK